MAVEEQKTTAQVVPLVQVRIARTTDKVTVFMTRTLNGAVTRGSFDLGVDDPDWQVKMGKALEKFAAEGKV